MTTPLRILLSLPLCGLLLTARADETSRQSQPKPPSPVSLCAQVQNSLKQVKSSCVSVSSNGYGSGVIISRDGLILTAAHMMRDHDPKKPLQIKLEDHTQVSAVLLGLNRETDLALLRITTDSDREWPHCPLAEMAPTTGRFCFTLAHPSGWLKGRPAQVRIGRITSHSMRQGKPFYLFADCNIQPGDSGGPLFSIDGKLIGIASSAANIPGFNIFPAIDQYHLDKKRLLNSERWGDDAKAPDSPAFTQTSIDKKVFNRIQEEFMRRVQIQYAPTLEFVQKLADETGEVKLNQQDIVDHMTRDALALANNQELSLGLDAPELILQLPDIPKHAPKAIPLYRGKAHGAFGVLIDDRHILTKASLFPKGEAVTIKRAEETIPLQKLAESKQWDIAIYESPNQLEHQAISWPKDLKPVTAGDLLIYRDRYQRLGWNIACDQARIVSKKLSIGPLKDKTIISKHRAPYPLAIRHALPLHASDAGTPVFNQNGQFIGIHIARFSRTLGLIIPAKELKEECDRLLQQR
ncbi:trypsin-like peptidase domain-containing protein [Verrucomicrobiaceae bacterium N1E253]|uniref:Trypsin-like peptidase domain-containing protein n=1 Tax=Oceaniferula marina TaxID=2748318 RepID=A0A851GD88_9BACT|nr:trypsin-like peptidase domain-containing protein [Oceaniferula marina]NWK54902.1 trypsin-like peptidase domain-containing protein [Oceaniferula marina]